MKKLLIALIMLGLILAGCNTEEPEMSDEDRQAIVETVDSLFEAMLKEGENLNQENFDAMYDRILPTDDDVWMGKPAVLLSNLWLANTSQDWYDGFKSMVGSRAGTLYENIDNHYAVLSSKSVIQVFKSDYYVVDMESNPGDVHQNTVTVNWYQKDGEWKIVHWHQSWE